MTATAIPAGRRFSPLDYVPDVAASLIFVFMSTRLFGIGPVMALCWIGVFGLLVVVKRQEFLTTLVRWWPLLLLPILCSLSFFWSEVPAATARYGLQLLVTCIVGLFIARLLSPMRFAMALFVGMFVYCILSVLSGHKGMSAEGMVLIGLSGSKNLMSFAGGMLALSATAVLLNRESPLPARALAIPATALGAYIILITNSATGLLLTIVGVFLLALITLAHRFTPAGRLAAIIVAAVLAAPFVAIWPEISDMLDRFMIDVLHKDPTLTGRTYLWERAWELIQLKPVLGHGFQAIWLGESADTLGLLRWSGQTDGRVFNFHNAYLQIGVDLGFVGMGLLIVTFATSAAAGLRNVLLSPNVGASFAFVFLLMMLAKSTTEISFSAFSTQTMLLMSMLHYAWRSPSLDAEQAAGSSPPPKKTRPRRPGARGFG